MSDTSSTSKERAGYSNDRLPLHAQSMQIKKSHHGAHQHMSLEKVNGIHSSRKNHSVSVAPTSKERWEVIIETIDFPQKLNCRRSETARTVFKNP